MNFKINEIFDSIQGEGLFVGVPMNFIRFTECNLHCRWCIGYKKGRHIPRIICSAGRNKKIFEVKEGDKLLAMNEKGVLVETVVKKIFMREVVDYYEIKIEGKPLLYFTGEHPLYVDGEWKAVRDLEVEDEVFYITHNEKMRFFAKYYNPMLAREVVEKRLKSIDYKEIGRKISRTRRVLFKENKLKPSITILKEKNLTRYQKMAEILSKRMKTENPMRDPKIVEKAVKINRLRGHYKRHSQRMKTKNPAKTKEFKEYMKKNNPMKRAEVVMKNWASHQKRPSSIEKRIKEIADEFSLPISYVGNGKFRVNGKNPDFIVNPVEKTKKVIEVFDPTYLKRSEKWIKERVIHFEDNGYKCLVLPLTYKTPDDEILTKLRNFISNGLKIERIKRFKADKRYPYFNPEPLQVYNFYCESYNNYFVDYILVHNCDTDFENGEILELNEILSRLSKKWKWVSLTGGEPMLEENLLGLIKELREEGFKVLLETNGTIFDEEIFDACNFISVDIKPPSSGNPRYDKKVIDYQFKNPGKSQLKVVIQDNQDLEFFKGIYTERYENWILQPEFSSRDKLDYEKMLKGIGKNVRIIPQIHKLLKVR